MSTTVTYKGSTLTTVDNQTRTLETAGTYLEDDITLVDVSQSAPVLQAKTNIAPTTSSQTITADSGYDGLSSVQINAIPTPTRKTVSEDSTTTSSTTSCLFKQITSMPDVFYFVNANTLSNPTANSIIDFVYDGIHNSILGNIRNGSTGNIETYRWLTNYISVTYNSSAQTLTISTIGTTYSFFPSANRIVYWS